ncbi:hypothetical protein RSJ42_13265 [Methanosarcina hadiensis]|uniref:hypothetical protein n=1 Tax=Methanosarcina hadiensis TaxID=3078083 RepID=UPI0039774050
MKPIINKYVFRKTSNDSGSLTTMSSIIHKVAEQGKYSGIVFLGDIKVGKFFIRVGESREEAQEEGVPLQQIDIDLSSFNNSTGVNGNSTAFTLLAGGHIVFYVSKGSKEYAVEIFRLGKQKEPIKVFDSRLLGDEDLFITHVMKPGSYSVRNVMGGGQAILTVEYPEHEKLMRNMESVLIECRNGTMDPAEIKIQPLQTLMFSCTRESRINIELKMAEERPQPALAPIITPVAILKKKKTGEVGQKNIRRRIQFFG